MSMIKPAFPVVNSDAALSAHLVWAALMTDDGANSVRNGGSDDLTFRDLVDPDSPAYQFFESFSGTEGLTASPDRTDSGITLDSNSWARLEAALGGVNFEVPGATGGSETQHWMLAIRLRASGAGTIVHKGRSIVSTDLHAYVTANTLAVAVGNQTLSMNTSGAPYTDGAPFVSGSQDMTLVIASAGSGRFKVTYTGHPQERFGPLGAAAAQLLDPSDNPFPVRLGARATLDDADDDTVTNKHPDLTIYSMQVFRRATVFTQAEMLSVANDTYQCFREANHPQSVSDQAAMALAFNKAFCWIGDSQSIENANRLPQAVKEKYIPSENASSMYLSFYCQSPTVGSSRTFSTPTGMTWPKLGAPIDDAGLPASLDRLLCSPFSLATFSGNVADAAEMVNILLWNLSSVYAGDAIWTQGIALEAVLLYAGSPAMTSPGNLQMRTQRGGTADSTFTPDFSTAGLKSHRLAVPAQPASAQTFIRVRAAAGVDETGGEIVMLGGYFERPDGSGGRLPGYGYDSAAFGGYDAAEWLAESSAIAFGDKWAQTVIPEQVNIMLGHNQAAGHTTQLDAGDLTGDYTDDITAFCDMVIEGASAARHQTLDFSTRTSVILTTPWRAIAGTSPMDDETNAETVEAVHAALAAERNFVHVSLYSAFGGENPLDDGLHPGDGDGDPETERELVADGWVAQLQGLITQTSQVNSVQIGSTGDLEIGVRFGVDGEFSAPTQPGGEHIARVDRITLTADGDPVTLTAPDEWFNSVNDNISVGEFLCTPKVLQGQVVNISMDAGAHEDANGVTSEAFSENGVENGSDVEPGEKTLRTRPSLGGGVLRTRERIGGL